MAVKKQEYVFEVKSKSLGLVTYLLGTHKESSMDRRLGDPDLHYRARSCFAHYKYSVGLHPPKLVLPTQFVQ